MIIKIFLIFATPLEIRLFLEEREKETKAVRVDELRVNDSMTCKALSPSHLLQA